MVTEAASGVWTARNNPRAADAEGQAATEYRGVSVLMADLVGSTDLMEDLGAEGYAEIIRRFHAICNTAVRKRGGVVAQYQGDGIICYFGFPHSSEDDAVRAIEAALGIMDGLRAVSGSTPFAARIGISSGSVMIRSDGDEFGANAVGSAINRAARLESLAEKDTILICHDTQRLVGSMFNLKDLGPRRLKGFRFDENIFLVTGTRRGVATRFEALRGRVTGAMVGRDAELGRLNEIFEACRAGSGRTVILSADAGIGKSRLVQAFLHGLTPDRATTFVLQCSPENSSTPLHPVSRYIEWIAGASHSDSDASRHNKIKRLFQKVWQTDVANTDLLLDLLSPLGAEAEMDPTESIPLRRRRALTLLAEKFFGSVAGRGALVLVLEDVHWIDPTSAAFIEVVTAKAASSRAMVLLTTRREPPYGSGVDGAELIEISRLNDADSQRRARQILAGASLSADHLQQITEKGEGVPLFLEEYADMLREAKSSSLTGDKVPLTLAGLVQSKLDRLDPNTRMFAQAGSALGRRFSPDLVERALGLTPMAVGDCIAALEAMRLGFRQGTVPEDNSIVFSHALVRDAIYGSLSGDGKKRLHNAIAGVFLVMGIESKVGEQVMAYHLKHAGRYEEAVTYYLRAGIKAA
ncbi:adenylate/guanylate cyclase domain-containing protein, partial [Cypionkella sp.]|uniref:ATP-binding protein n=1 Tax=Cypionkella sp. TaxID=2811411 RepID=UPI0026389997